MNCKCGGTYTIVSSMEPGDRVKRIRKCVDCGCVFYTIEVCLEDFERLEFRSMNYQAIVSPEARSAAKAAADKVLRQHGR